MSLSQEERTLGGLAHLGVLFGWVGLAFDIILLVVYLPKSRYVAKHAKQALGLWTVWFLARLALGFVSGGAGLWVALNPARFFTGDFLSTILFSVLGLLVLGIGVLVMVIQAMVKGFNGEEYRYPIIGDLVASVAGE